MNDISNENLGGEGAHYFDIEMPDTDSAIQGASSVESTFSNAEGSEVYGLTQEEWDKYRQAVTYLLKHGLIYEDENPDLFKSVSQNRELASSTYKQFFLELKHDLIGGFYILLQEDTELPHASLISRKSLSLQDSVILVYLRKFYLAQDIAGVTQPKIDVDTLVAGVKAILPKSNSESIDERRVRSALKNFIDKRFIRKVRGDDDAFQITPVLRYVVTASEMEHIIEQLKKLAIDRGLDLVAGQDIVEGDDSDE
ncbi:DUF4194 domain-containing protein [Mangrovimicrobium sediminis]|uniref:DUF4194 domain-containing protein n=1 Tax=Mangrovimicrobium sediminis TaxID=2562682 RepID=A0A4Z0LYI8_9GAMM|nr:DUF4194 domain-containing protein [Haliea sp. SAOS-164]TGD72217.1 DUF4194 domain-containing protein [Haliea sp. SAOS-164]